MSALRVQPWYHEWLHVSVIPAPGETESGEPEVSGSSWVMEQGKKGGREEVWREVLKSQPHPYQCVLF